MAAKRLRQAVGEQAWSAVNFRVKKLTLGKPQRSAPRISPWAFDMQQFVTDHPSAIRGSIDPAALASGNYHCTVVCRLTTGEEFTVRDFDFTL